MQKEIGCLVLHGYSSHISSVDGIVPYLEKAGIPYRMPYLRGHGGQPADLEGVQWPDWLKDAESAMADLQQETPKVAVVGLSMGGLLALHLAARHPDEIAGIVTVAAALRLQNPLAPGSPFSFLAPIVMKIVHYWPNKTPYTDPAAAVSDKSYHRLPANSVVTFLEYTKVVENILPQISVPARILQSRADGVVKPESAQIIYDRITSTDKKVIWFEKTNHEMMRDVEKEAVFETIMQSLHEFGA